MATKRKKTSAAKQTAASKKRPTGGKKRSQKKQGFLTKLRLRVDNFLQRRPHRSFRLTRRRDYKRSLALPGYWMFAISVVRILHQNRNLFFPMACIYLLFSVVVMGIASQENFTAMQEGISEAGREMYEGDWSALGTAAILTISTVAGRVAPDLTESQQVYAILLGLLVWLTTVWLLRQRMAGHTVRLRDGLYSAGSPIVATLIVTVIVALQLLPVLLASIGHVAATNAGLLSGGVEAMLFWVVAGGLVTLSLYWITTSLLAMVVVTLPGMYPIRALRVAGDMVIGRRLRILLRLAWMFLLLLLFWVVVLVPIIFLDISLKSWLPALQWLPVVPLAIAVLTTISVIWISSYVYVLYRKIVDDETSPA